MSHSIAIIERKEGDSITDFDLAIGRAISDDEKDGWVFVDLKVLCETAVIVIMKYNGDDL